jgi:hypothetical protein
MGMSRIKRTISGMDAVDRAAYWLSQYDDDEDEAIELALRCERGRRRNTIIAAINFVVRRRAAASEEAAA